MLKKTMILASMAVAAIAFALPAVAGAEWAKNTHKATVQENVTFTVTDANFQGQLGGTTCTNAHSNTTLTPGTTGHVNSFTANAEECSTSGTLAFFGCTVTKVESTTETPWVAHNTTENLHITGVKIHNYMHGAFCPYSKLTLKGEVTVTPEGTHHHLKTGTISGTLEVYNGSSTAFIQNVSAGGQVHVVPENVYGLTPTT